MSAEEIEAVFYGVATVGERGQIVIPAKARRQLGVQPGDKLLVLGHPSGRALTIARVADFLRFAEQMRQILSLGEQAPPGEEAEK